jgi:cell wall-associated NlpC family hydrolase
VSTVAFGLAAPAGAAPAGSAAPGTRDLNVLNEQYNLTRLRLDRASAKLQATQARLAATKVRVEGVRALVRARAARLYTGAAAGGVTAVLDVNSVTEFGRRTQYVSAAAKPDRKLLTSLADTLDRLEARQAATAKARDALRAQADATASARKKLLDEAAAARAKAQADAAGPIGTPRAMLVASSGSSARTGTPVTTAPRPQTQTPANTPQPTSPAPTTPTPTTPAPVHTNPPAPTGRGATAVAFARAQLGKPYAFATAGPATFDCSGLTMAAWRSAGVSMAHYSGSQAASFPKVSWDQLQPGDIVVFYSDYHHVGLYIGGGQMIHAPQTGDVVKVAPAWRETFQFGVRPG